ncbi:hypothetical protein AGR3A_Cc200011 [Agrobacterium tomkonis CFBP 6623]|uniref:Uncharacterized protein n=1 Tax=Agrobacterium tomkonis CFBP 6623 TaxID=1183432 RepID=A0A1S7P9C1_9HYPH|nr:hypothetical protein AGR3A_Cc200011 [Agrobacterium tomkonis CFBP 6623]
MAEPYQSPVSTLERSGRIALDTGHGASHLFNSYIASVTAEAGCRADALKHVRTKPPGVFAVPVAGSCGAEIRTPRITLSLGQHSQELNH